MSNLVDSIENSDAALHAAITNIRQITNGRDNFEKVTAMLQPVDPYVKNNANKRSVSFQISTIWKASSFGRGKQTGVDLRWYQADAYAKLKPAEKRELNAWQRTNEGRKYVATEKKAFYMSKKEIS